MPEIMTKASDKTEVKFKLIDPDFNFLIFGDLVEHGKNAKRMCKIVIGNNIIVFGDFH